MTFSKCKISACRNITYVELGNYLNMFVKWLSNSTLPKFLLNIFYASLSHWDLPKKEKFQDRLCSKKDKANCHKSCKSSWLLSSITVAVRRNTTLEACCIRLWMCKNEFMNICAEMSEARKISKENQTKVKQTVSEQKLFLITRTLTMVNEESTIPQFI